MNPDKLAVDTLEWAFSGQRQMTRQHRKQVRGVLNQVKAENYETGGKRRSRWWRLGPAWGKLS